MPSYYPPKKATQYIFYVGLESVASAGTFQTNPTLASGDVTVSKDGGTSAPIGTLPTVTPTGGKFVKVTLSSTEMDADNVTVLFSDAAGGEWKSLMINLQTAANQLDDVATNVSAILADTGTDGVVVASGSKAGYSLASDQSSVTVGTVNALGATALASVNAEVDTALGDYDAPTKAELDSGLAALNNVSSSDVQTAAAAALTAYDPPTATEMDAAFTEIKGATWASTDTLEAIRDRGDAAWTTADVAGALATYDGPTKAELDTAQASIEADIAALNNLSASDIDARLAAYDAPTKAELDTAVSTLATAAALATVDTVVDGIKAVTDNLPDGGALTTIDANVDAILNDTGTSGVVVASLSTSAKADVNAEVVDALSTDTYAEPSSAPPATASLAAKIGWLMKLARNKLTQNSNTQTLYADEGLTAQNTATVADDGSTFTRGEWS